MFTWLRGMLLSAQHWGMLREEGCTLKASHPRAGRGWERRGQLGTETCPGSVVSYFLMLSLVIHEK